MVVLSQGWLDKRHTIAPIAQLSVASDGFQKKFVIFSIRL